MEAEMPNGQDSNDEQVMGLEWTTRLESNFFRVARVLARW